MSEWHSVHKRPPVYDATLRERILRHGEMVRVCGSSSTAALTRFVWGELQRAFDCDDPAQAQYRFSASEYFERLSRLRVALREHFVAQHLIRGMLREFGADLAGLRCDFLRLRAVQSGGHKNPLAANAYLLHRDTWYANPKAQVNWWLAVSDVREEEGPGFFPALYQSPVHNSSALFDYATWKRLGGWQCPNSAKHFPTVTDEPRGTEKRLSAQAGDLWFFAGQHLHGTRAHDSGRTRFSLELRVIHHDDSTHAAPCNVDNASRGDASTDYVPP